MSPFTAGSYRQVIYFSITQYEGRPRNLQTPCIIENTELGAPRASRTSLAFSLYTVTEPFMSERWILAESLMVGQSFGPLKG
jgi:hypothetical protein